MTATDAATAPWARLRAHAGRLSQSGDGFVSSGLIVICVRLAGAALALGAQVLASRHAGAEAFGQYALILVWLLLLGHGSTVGTSQLVCRFLSGYSAQERPDLAAGVVRFALQLALGAAVLTALTAILLVRSGLFGLDLRIVALATLAFAVVPLIVLQDVLESVARGLDRPHLGIAPAILLRHLAIIAGIGSMMVLGLDADAFTIMAFTVAGLVASICVQAALLWRALGPLLRGIAPLYERRLWLRTAVPLSLLDASELLFYNADILILGLFMPPEIVAFYFAATRLAQILAYVPYGISAATAQKYPPLSAPGDRQRLQSLVSAVTALSAGLALTGTIGLAVLAPWLLALFGPGYETASTAVVLLSLGIVFQCGLGPGQDILNMTGQERICSAVFALALGVNLALNFALIPVYGMAGAASASMIALLVRGLLLAFFAHARLGLFLPLGTQALASVTFRKADP